MKRSQLTDMPEYFDRYINKCEDVELIEAINTSISELEKIPLDKWKSIGTKVYAPGKWTISDILQHIIDTERIFNYRVLAYSRDEQQSVPSFDEDSYAVAAIGKNRTLESLLNELKIVHQSTKALYESFTPTMLDKMCIGFKGKYSVAAAGFMIPGHQRWHFSTIEERYLPLLKQ